MVRCMKCKNVIPKIPHWLGDVTVGFVCDSCKVRTPGYSGAGRKKAPPVEPVVEEAELLGIKLDIDVEEEEEAVVEAPMVEVVAEAEPPAEVEPEPAPAKTAKAKKAKEPEEKKAPGAEPATLLGKALVQALTEEKPKKGSRSKKPE